MLCDNCKGNAFIANIGTCKSCGSMTSSGAFKLCAKCSLAKNECAACGKPVQKAPPIGKK